MTPTSHNKILGILHLAYGGFIALLMGWDVHFHARR